MVKYDRLWETMRKKEISQYRLIKYYNFSAGQIDRLKKNMYVSTHTIETLCSILRCPVQDVMEVFPEKIPEPDELSDFDSASKEKTQKKGAGSKGKGKGKKKQQ